MQPLIVSEQTRKAIADFLAATFPATTPGFETLMARFLREPENLAKGPYITLGLPFRSAADGTSGFDWYPTFRPHAHQALSFARLSEASARSTLIATGTGSGKTEAFLFPVLEHCRQMRASGRKGVKAVFVYPMNALATDQASRIAKEILSHPELSRVTAGLYVGDEAEEQSTTVRQLAGNRYSVITDRDRMREEPPDILLTNYRMLDFLLMRARDAALWRHNEPDTMRFLVVDELHAYDGAQGTDLSCLIRRLKARLRTPPSTLVCVGTSATMGTGGNERLISFAEDVFGEPFDSDAVVGEERESITEYLRDNSVDYMDTPSPSDYAAMSPQSYGSADEYIAAQHRLWFGSGVEANEVADLAFQVDLGHRLKRHFAFQNLLRDVHNLGDRAVLLDELSDVVRRRLRDVTNAPPDYARLWIGSLLAMIAHASTQVSGDARRPLLSLRVELWLRELKRMVASLSAEPVLLHSDDLAINDPRVCLPLIHCRDCHAMGWGATQTATDGAILRPDLRTFYAAFFNEDVSTRFVFPADEGVATDQREFQRKRACTQCGALNYTETAECTYCGAGDLLLVDVARNLREGRRNGAAYTRAHHDCPYCQGDRTLTIVGAQAASLASVALGRFFGSRYNSDKKLIAFSDSVQDAAHRAGFFEARNWRLNLRPAMARVIHDSISGGAPLTLAQLPEVFEARWLTEFGDKLYIRTFLPPSLNWLRDYQAVVEEDASPTEYLCNLNRRGLTWAMLGEFGQDAHVGRTLPRTLTSIVAFNLEGIDRAASFCCERMSEQVEALHDIDVAQVRVFLHGLLAHLLRVGAIWNEGLLKYAQRGCNIFAYRNNPAEFALLKSPRRPRYLTLFPYQKCDSVTGDDSEFYRQWALKALGGLALTVDDTIFADVYRIALEGLAIEQIARKEESERVGTVVWGIEPSACFLSGKARQWRCNECRNLAISDFSLDLDGTVCRQLGCRGIYRPLDSDSAAFYRDTYLSTDVRRIHAHEHTGLLDRGTRERVERDFRTGKLNVMSATPTLEMGIDIGDLSAVMLCSVPPQQANYVQRIGRAGRKTGNAFLPTLASGRPHDLYFWSQPREMLAGDIDTPGVFLNASAVLERQLTAFTLDCWVRSKGDQARVPLQLSEVLSATRNANQRKFPYPWFAFIEENQATLLAEFTELFNTNDTTLSDGSHKHLEAFLLGSVGSEVGLRWKIINGLNKVIRDLDDLKRRRTRVETEITRIDGLPARGESDEEERRELKIERAALTSLMARVNGRDTYEFLTDQGLLPNYAFPEQGVLLNSVIVRDDRRGSEEQRTLTFEYERPGASAITEFAPNSVFYAEGRKVTIDQVDVAHDKPVSWRFCRSCSFAQEEPSGSEFPACPRCGDTMWADAGRVQKMMRLTKVYARTFESRSRIGDDADDRERRFFVRQALVDVAPEAVRQAWAVDDPALPFAFEFVGRIRFREVNFGEQNGEGLPVQIAGNDERKPGFAICPECGAVQRQRRSDDLWKNHALYCSKRRQTSPTTEECVFLYREFDSEGIRVYLPESNMGDTEQEVHSFIAALQIGLEEKFHGSVDHLKIARDINIAQDQETPRQYLVIYDSVPGGTGYLKDLMLDTNPFFDVFRLALNRLNTCSCNSDENKDGCYRCVYNYYNSYDRKHVSRRTAIRTLSDIVQHQSSLRPIKTIGEVTARNALFDSELERRFVEALRRRPTDGSLRLELKEEIVRGKPGYFLKAEDFSWSIEPQVSLGTDDGVVIPCKPDFVLWPDTVPDCLPIAVFLDGWRYHRDRIGDDVSKRMAVARSGKFTVWTLTADDIASVLEPDNTIPETLWASAFVSGTDQAAPLYNRFSIAELKAFHSLTAFEQLRARIAGLTDNTVQRIATALALRIGAGPLERAGFENLDTSDGLEVLTQSQVFHWPDNPDIGRCWSTSQDQIQIGVQARTADLVHLPDESRGRDQQPCIVMRWAPRKADDATIRKHWRQWWHAGNLLLNAPNGWLTADQGCNLTALVNAPAYRRVQMSAEWDSAAQVAHSSVQQLLTDLFALGIGAPDVGFELLGPDRRIVAESELAWPQQKVAVVLRNQLEDEFVADGWTVFAIDADGLSSNLVNLLK
jgi:DEAD/DEAH box helicase domain-containing protein